MDTPAVVSLPEVLAAGWPAEASSPAARVAVPSPAGDLLPEGLMAARLPVEAMWREGREATSSPAAACMPGQAIALLGRGSVQRRIGGTLAWLSPPEPRSGSSPLLPRTPMPTHKPLRRATAGSIRTRKGPRASGTSAPDQGQNGGVPDPDQNSRPSVCLLVASSSVRFRAPGQSPLMARSGPSGRTGPTSVLHPMAPLAEW